MVVLQGRFLPLVTPFTDDTTTVSEVRLARLIRSLTNGGAEGFVLASESGEFSALGPSERKDLLELTLRLAPGASVVVNVSTDSTMRSLDLAQHAARHGARAAIAMPPRYPILSDAELLQHFATIAKHGPISLLAVDPSGSISSNLRAALEQVPNICAVPAGSYADRWECGEASCHPAWTVECLGRTVDRGALEDKLAKLGHSQVMKALLDALDVEVGPPRAPAQWAPSAIVRELLS